MIRGIANRLGIDWGLSDRWAPLAVEAIAAIDPKESLPVWSVSIPNIVSTVTTNTVTNSRTNVSNINLSDITIAFKAAGRLLLVCRTF